MGSNPLSQSCEVFPRATWCLHKIPARHAQIEAKKPAWEYGWITPDNIMQVLGGTGKRGNKYISRTTRIAGLDPTR